MGVPRLPADHPLRRPWVHPRFERGMPTILPFREKGFREWFEPPPESYCSISKVLTNTSVDSATGGNLTISLPTSILATDVAVLCVGLGRSGGAACGSYGTPTSWTKVGEVINVLGATGHITGQVFLSLGNNTNLTFTISGAADTKGYMCVAFRGADNGTPLDASGTANSGIGVNSLVANLVTVVTDQSLHMIGTFDWLGGNLTATSFTQAQNGTTNETACLLYNTTPKPQGSTGTVTVNDSASATNQAIIAIPFALRPQDSPELRGRPTGLSGQRQTHQLLAG